MNILLVEDHCETAHALSRLLRSRGHRVVVAGSVDDAMAAAEVAEFDLLISDVCLPDGSGLGLLSKLRERRPVAGIALTGRCEDGDGGASAKAGFTEHLVKPVQFRDLEAAIRRATGRGPGGSAVEPAADPSDRKT